MVIHTPKESVTVITDDYLEIPCWSSSRTFIATTRDPQDHSIRYPRRHLDLDLLGFLYQSRSMTIGTGILDDLSSSGTCRTGSSHAEEPL